jgi:MFS family permease
MADASAPPEGGVNTSMVVAASAAGTAFEWYDFFVFGTLASIISARFTSGSQSAGFLFTLGAFAAGFIVRPFGALVFGHIGDRYGRKRAFIQTILLMGVSTMAIGLLPGMETIGVAAPILLVLIRVIQGFAMGGEYGGAAVYVAEHAHPARRGLLTGGSSPQRPLGCCWHWVSCWQRARFWARPPSRPGDGACLS